MLTAINVFVCYAVNNYKNIQTGDARPVRRTLIRLWFRTNHFVLDLKKVVAVLVHE